MATAEIKAQIESSLNSLRDLSYTANAEWEKAGMENGDLLTLSVKAGELLNDLSKTIAFVDMTFNGAPSKMRLLPGGCDKKIQAIKAVRQQTGEGLKEAKEMVDRLANGGWVTIDYKAGYKTPDDAMSKAFVAEMRNLGVEVK